MIEDDQRCTICDNQLKICNWRNLCFIFPSTFPESILCLTVHWLIVFGGKPASLSTLEAMDYKVPFGTFLLP